MDYSVLSSEHHFLLKFFFPECARCSFINEGELVAENKQSFCCNHLCWDIHELSWSLILGVAAISKDCFFVFVN